MRFRGNSRIEISAKTHGGKKGDFRRPSVWRFRLQVGDPPATDDPPAFIADWIVRDIHVRAIRDGLRRQCRHDVNNAVLHFRQAFHRSIGGVVDREGNSVYVHVCHVDAGLCSSSNARAGDGQDDVVSAVQKTQGVGREIDDLRPGFPSFFFPYSYIGTSPI